ncbi:MAG: cell division protein ZipA [Marinagarivorans sp.]|nr:cell division protein ZipA [Marinagarivorans sp.]
MREWLTVIIVLLIIGIILDGIRRVRTSKRNNIQMSKKMPNEDLAPLEEVVVSSEFPRGGARIASYRHPDDVVSIHENLKTSLAAKKKTLGVSDRKESPLVAAPLRLEDEPSLGNFDHLDDDVAFENTAVNMPINTRAPAAEAALQEHTLQPVDELSYSAYSAEPVAQEPRVQEAKKAPVMVEPEEVIVINVMAREGYYFNGNDLLDVLTAQNMRYGDMEIFHRHKNDDGTGEALFSLVNMIKPGIFDLNTMDEFETPGISMFMMLPLKSDAISAFGLMARTAKALAAALDGEIKDENRSVMTQQTFEHCRQRVIEFDRKRRLSR